MTNINTLIDIPITNIPRNEIKTIQRKAIIALLEFGDDNAYVFSLLQTIMSSSYNLGYIDFSDELHWPLNNVLNK